MDRLYSLAGAVVLNIVRFHDEKCTNEKKSGKSLFFSLVLKNGYARPDGKPLFN
jgi:hypothetical protein